MATICFCGFYGFLYAFISLRDEGRGPFGLEIRSTEEIRKGFDLSNVAQNLRHFPGLESGKKAQDPFGGIYFDDGRKLVPPSDDRINTNILGVVS